MQEPFDNYQARLGVQNTAELMFEEDDTLENDGSREQPGGTSGSSISSTLERDHAILTMDVQEVSKDPSDTRTSVHESWTFPESIRNGQLKRNW